MNNSWTTRCSFLLVALLFACESSQGVCNASSVRVTPVRGFSVSVRLSELATKKLADRRETIVVFGYVYGGPKAGAPESLVSDMGEIGLGDFRTEISPGASATFEELRLKDKSLEQIAGSPKLLINVVSGRKSSKDNLLDCSTYEGELKAVQGTSIPIQCKLIGE